MVSRELEKRQNYYPTDRSQLHLMAERLELEMVNWMRVRSYSVRACTAVELPVVERGACSW